MSAVTDDIVGALKDRISELALALLGEPNRALSDGSSWRYGRNGSLAIEIEGAKRGLWYSYEGGEGGGPLQLIQREQALDIAGAFRWARDWLGDARLRPAPKRNRAQTKRPSTDETEPRKDATAYAHETWARSVPIAGTVAERYLRWHRCIPGELPGHLGMVPSLWHKEAKANFPALLVPAFGDGGVLLRLHAIYLDPVTHAIYLDPVTGDKADVPRKKKTFGRGTMPAIFCGPPGGPFDVVLTEGPEDALSLRSALEVGDVAATLGAGSLHRLDIPPGTRVCIVADNDAAGVRAAEKAAAKHTMAGCEVWIAKPPADIKDSNQLLQIHGAAGIHAVLAAAKRFQPAQPEAPAIGTLTAEEASQRTWQAIARFFGRAMSYVPELPDPLDLNVLEPPPPFAMGIRGSIGLGKSEATLQQIIRPEMAGRFINYYGPEHKLNAELLARFQAMAGPDAPKARIVYGREQVRPDGVEMCQKADLAKDITLLGKDPQPHLCEKRHKVGEIDPKTGHQKTVFERCEFFEGCPYQQQRADKGPGVRFLSHAHLFVKPSVKRVDAIVIDESFWQASLRGMGGYFIVPNDLRLPRRELSDGANADLVAISERCVKAIYAGGRLQDFVDAGVTAEDASWARGAERSRIEKLNVTPAMPRKWQEEAIKNYRQQQALKFARFFSLLAECLTAGVDPSADCFDLKLDQPTADKGVEDRLFMIWRAKLRAPEAPALLLDANLEADIAQRFFPGLEPPVIAEARLQGYHATQITDHAVPKARLVPPPHSIIDPAETKRRANRRGELRRLVEVEAWKGKTLLVTYKDVQAAIEDEGEIPNASYAHWNALRGHDEWRDVETLAVAGVPQPSVETIEQMAKALWHLDRKPIETIPPDCYGAKRYKREFRLITLADGTTRPVEVDVHPDPRCTLLLDQIRAEAMQAIGRARLVHRDPTRPCRVIILTNYPLPLPIHELSTWDDVMPDPLAVLIARGILPENKNHAAMVLKDIFPEGGHSLRQWLCDNPAVGGRWNQCVRFPYKRVFYRGI